MYIVMIIVGLALLTFGANLLTNGAVGVAKRLRVSEFMIGATIVAVGTSMPEFVVSVQSAIQGQADVSIGNVVGSNIFNIYAILGLTSMLVPITFVRSNVRADIPICLAVSLLLCVLALDMTLWGGAHNELSRWDGLLLLVGYGAFLWYMIRQGRSSGAVEEVNSNDEQEAKQKPLWRSLLLVALGIGGLVLGSDMFLDGSIELARRVGLSEAVIGIVFVAAGTSLPELFASLVPALRGKNDIALGNILGSNIANILLILGTSATITPLRLGGITAADMAVMVSAVVAVLLSAFVIGRNKISRFEGLIFFGIYVVYTLWLLGVIVA
ncbi:MAG: calcium/sodium antiporter [Rikenellaceae bacterium]|nr:calcium/sodium antiporter [Rikenellaceae bacterium]